MIYFGTSGFSYNDWVGQVYPKGMPRQEWLSYYSSQFDALELNSSYYAIPSLAVVKSLISRTGEGFQFAVKANQDITHGRQPEESQINSFIGMLSPFIASKKLGCVLAQFPYSFGFNRQNQDYLEQIGYKFGDIPLVAEFRNAGWVKAEVFQWLKNKNIGFCCVDEPRLPNLIPPIAEVAGNIAYLRFHGRNTAKWWQHEHAYERYDYTYSEQELEEWLPGIKKLAEQSEKTFIFANNHYKGQSVKTIRQLRLMLD